MKVIGVLGGVASGKSLVARELVRRGGGPLDAGRAGADVGRLRAREAERLAASGSVAAALDAPLLLEAGWDKLCNALVFVDAPREIRLARARKRGWPAADLAARG